jgi:hypothetical protein
MEDDPVIEALRDEALDVRDVTRREIGTHFDNNRAFGRLERQCISCFGHVS